MFSNYLAVERVRAAAVVLIRTLRALASESADKESGRREYVLNRAHEVIQFLRVACMQVSQKVAERWDPRAR